MLGVALLHLLPHAFHLLGSLDAALYWALFGFLVVFFVQRFFHFHHHDVPGEHLSECHHVHDEQRTERENSAHGEALEVHGHEHCCEAHSLAEQSARRLSWTGATFGLLLHSLFDGIAVAAAVRAESQGHRAMLAGFGTFLVVLLHKPFDALAIGTLLARGRHEAKFRHLINGVLAVSIPVGMLLFQVGVGGSMATTGTLGAVLAFSAGTFLCISTSDLLPELQFHAHDRFKLSGALLLGLGLSIGIGWFEYSGHDRHQERTGETTGAAHESHGDQ
jgi:zinc and cadmium transporter